MDYSNVGKSFVIGELSLYLMYVINIPFYLFIILLVYNFTFTFELAYFSSE